MLEDSVVQEIRGILLEEDLERKLASAETLCARRDGIGRGAVAAMPLGSVRPRRPAGFRVLLPHEVPARAGLQTAEGRFRLLHAVASIEVSAVELALSTSAFFPGEDAEFHQDWLRVAGEEVVHARMVLRRLEETGGAFGSEPVHLGLWDTASGYTTLVERLAVVPRIQEARGLDVSARLRDQFRRHGDEIGAAILERIYREEVGHVAAGTRWFQAACRREGADPERRFVEILNRFRRGRGLRPGPIDRDGRLAAGFTEREIEALQSPSPRDPDR